jgi:hypothetical protein
VLEVENQLRALLRDVLCGFLDADLKSAADDILLRSAEPFEIEARDTRRRFAPESTMDSAQSTEPEPVRRYWPQPTAVAQPEPEPPAPARAIEPEPAPRPAPPPAPEPEKDLDDGVTPSADWGFDDDPESYSAPV